MSMRQKTIFVLVLLLTISVFIDKQGWFSRDSGRIEIDTSDSIGYAFENKLRNIQVTGSGRVKALLKDDLKGSRHQKFILRVPSGHTILIAHNIDLAPRIDSIQKGDRVDFSGEYEWNEKGGVVHWTHHDPDNKHTGGWLKHNGRMYR